MLGGSVRLHGLRRARLAAPPWLDDHDFRRRHYAGCGPRRERDFQHFVDPAYRADIELALDVVRNLHQVLAVFLRNHDHGDAAALRGQELFLQATDREHLTAQGDLAGHGDVGAHGDACQGGNQGGAHADAGAGPVLGRRTLGHVQVDVNLLVEIRLEAEHLGARAHHRHRSLDRLLHHFAQLARVHELALAGPHGRLDGQQLAADLRPGQSRDLADAVLILRLAIAVAAHTQEFVEIARRNGHALFLALGQQQLFDRLAADLGDLALEIAHASLARVVTHDVSEARI